MSAKCFPVIDLVATGNNIRRLRIERGLTVRDIQSYFGFEEPRAVYKWQNGESLPTVDNLYALGNLLDVPMDGILVPVGKTDNSASSRMSPAAQVIFMPGCRRCAETRRLPDQFCDTPTSAEAP